MKKMLNLFICSSREKIMTVPRKKTQLDLKRMKKAETAAQLDKVIFFLVIICKGRLSAVF